MKRKTLQKSIRSLLAFSLLTGVAYPLVITGVAQFVGGDKANGSLIEYEGKTIGSSLIGQKFSKSEYFWARPSATDYGTMPSGASQLGPTSQKLKDRVSTSLKEMGLDPIQEKKPYDLLLTSGSGLDPDITPEGAVFQSERVAKARGLAHSEVMRLIAKNTQEPFLGIIGRPRVNVLKLNLALDGLKR